MRREVLMGWLGSHLLAKHKGTNSKGRPDPKWAVGIWQPEVPQPLRAQTQISGQMYVSCRQPSMRTALRPRSERPPNQPLSKAQASTDPGGQLHDSKSRKTESHKILPRPFLAASASRHRSYACPRICPGGTKDWGAHVVFGFLDLP